MLVFRGYASVFLLLFASALTCSCVPQASLYRADAEIAGNRLADPAYLAVFPSEVQDIDRTFELGDRELQQGRIEEADVYFRFALIKASLLEKNFQSYQQRKEQELRVQLEQQQQIEAELARQKQLAEEQAAEKARETVRVKAADAARRKAEKQKSEREQAAVTRYTVRRGETLPQIAAQPEVYGDSSLWPLLYRANRDQISAPAVLWPGQSLKVPRNFDRNDLNEARRFASEHPIR